MTPRGPIGREQAGLPAGYRTGFLGVVTSCVTGPASQTRLPMVIHSAARASSIQAMR
jgi:hypothetical protein